MEVIAPKQRRSAQTLAAILSATVDLLEQRDFHELSVSDIARSAGVSVGTIYTRFSDKEALLRHLVLELLRKQVSAFETLFAPEDWRGVGLSRRVLFLTRLLVASGRMQPGLQRTVALRHLSRRKGAVDEEQGLAERSRELITTWLLECRSEIAAPSPERSVAFALSLCLASIQSVLIFQAESMGLTDDDLADEAARAALASLRRDTTLPKYVPPLRWPGPRFKDF